MEPYTKIVEELPQMRAEMVQLVRQAVGAGRRTYVLVNNRAEGECAVDGADAFRDAEKIKAGLSWKLGICTVSKVSLGTYDPTNHLTQEVSMVSISKIIGIMSYSIVLSLSLSNAAQAGMKADPCADRKTGMQEQLGCDKDTQAGIETIKGEVLVVEGNSYLIHRSDGKEVRLVTDAATEVTPRIGRGDWIEAKVQEVEKQKHVMSIKQINK